MFISIFVFLHFSKTTLSCLTRSYQQWSSAAPEWSFIEFISVGKFSFGGWLLLLLLPSVVMMFPALSRKSSNDMTSTVDEARVAPSCVNLWQRYQQTNDSQLFTTVSCRHIQWVYYNKILHTKARSKPFGGIISPVQRIIWISRREVIIIS